MRSQTRRKPLALPTWALGLALVSSDRDWRGLRCTRHLLPHSPRGLLRSRPGLGEGVRPWLPLPGGEAAACGEAAVPQPEPCSAGCYDNPAAVVRNYN